jgi:hypothetical protein
MLDQAEASGIDLFITMDRNLKHQQELAGRAVSAGVPLPEVAALLGHPTGRRRRPQERDVTLDVTLPCRETEKSAASA